MPLDFFWCSFLFALTGTFDNHRLVSKINYCPFPSSLLHLCWHSLPFLILILSVNCIGIHASSTWYIVAHYTLCMCIVVKMF